MGIYGPSIEKKCTHLKFSFSYSELLEQCPLVINNDRWYVIFSFFTGQKDAELTKVGAQSTFQKEQPESNIRKTWMTYGQSGVTELIDIYR